MNASELTNAVVEELGAILNTVEDTQVQNLTELIAGAGQIFLAAAGRSLLVTKCCAMRLMQIGLTVHVVGEVTPPAIRPGELLIVTSGSGETATVVQMAKKAKKLGASLGAITILPESSLGRLGIPDPDRLLMENHANLE